MTQRLIDKTNQKFVYILSKTEGLISKRKDLIDIARNEFSLTVAQASGLIDRNIHILKMLGAVSPEGGRSNRKYVFQSEIINDARLSMLSSGKGVLASEKQALETELNLTKYELEAYNELLLKIPQEKNKIILLHKKTSEKFFQLNGKLRAINQLMAIQ